MLAKPRSYVGEILHAESYLRFARPGVGGEPVWIAVDWWKLTCEKDIKRKVFEALQGGDVKRNQQGKVALHGQTVWAWTTAIPGAPLRNGG